ncbi:MAG: phosphoribosylamine--glycine ligase [Bacteroidales bacterium]|nr:phosphoribosylamine--glycine ligase [Bacteroidales bacterium]
MLKNVLVVGGGGREHAIVDALSRSKKVGRIYCAPGNAGIGEQAFNVPIKDTDVNGLLEFAYSHKVDLTVVGPEAALSAGIVDAFRAHGLAIFGHTAAATAIESSKEFAKKLMAKYGIPTASYNAFSEYEEALDYVSGRPFPAVLKYDGLAAGKGVVIAANLEEADAALRSMLLDKTFGQGRVVVEDFLQGPEFSFLCFVNGADVYPMPLSQDHKRAFDGDKGPNTGGMGAYTGLPFITGEDREFALENIMKKAAAAMVSEGLPLSGVLYGGLMKTPDGIKVIEFNARFGDPETEVVLPLLESDIYDIFYGIATGSALDTPKWSSDVTLGVVLASKGYPGAYQKGFKIRGLDNINCQVYHMGTAISTEHPVISTEHPVISTEAEKSQSIVTNGGRVLMLVARGTDLAAARNTVYSEIAKIDCDNLFYRNDIAHYAL